MARDNGTEEAIIDAVIARLTGTLPTYFTSANLLLCMDWQAPQMTPGDICGLVGPDDGEFNESMLDGGGQEQATFATSIIVAVFTPIRTDASKRHSDALKNSTRGLLPIWRKILKSLTAWSPSSGGDQLTRNPIFPTTRNWVKTEVMSGKYLGFYQRFSVTYDVDLPVTFELSGDGDFTLSNGTLLEIE
jgi:hypothetical protein